MYRLEAGRITGTVVALACVFASGTARAATITFSGFFNDRGNAALVGSDLGAPLFGDDFEIANNVALYELTIPVAGTLTFESFGHTAGGAEPYFTLFEGTGGSATFLDSNFFLPDIDFTLTRFLDAGNYTLAVGVWLNMSFAENNPDLDPALGDGFIGLGGPDLLGNYYYELRVTQEETPPPPAPEPSTLLLLGGSLLGVVGRAQRKRKRSGDRRTPASSRPSTPCLRVSLF